MTSPAGAISKAQVYAAATLAASSTFQTLVGAEDATEALDSVYQDVLPAPADGIAHTLAELEAYRPYALVWTDGSGGFSREIDSAGSGNFYSDSGKIRIFIEQNVPDAVTDDAAEAELLWRNTVGSIIDDMSALAGVAGYISITRFDVDGPHRLHPDAAGSQGDAQYVEIAIDWGP